MIHLDMKVSDVILAINAGILSRCADFNGDYLYVFDTDKARFGELVVTKFDRCSHIGLETRSSKYGAGQTIRDVLSCTSVRIDTCPRYTILPKM